MKKPLWKRFTRTEMCGGGASHERNDHLGPANINNQAQNLFLLRNNIISHPYKTLIHFSYKKWDNISQHGILPATGTVSFVFHLTSRHWTKLYNRYVAVTSMPHATDLLFVLWNNKNRRQRWPSFNLQTASDKGNEPLRRQFFVVRSNRPWLTQHRSGIFA